MASGTLFQIQSLFILCLMGCGLYYRRRRSLHIKLMSGVIAWDILLILQIELNRGAVAKASQVVSNTALLNIHVGLALLCVLGYMGLIVAGRKLLAGHGSWRNFHRSLGWSVLVLRIFVFITSLGILP